MEIENRHSKSILQVSLKPIHSLGFISRKSSRPDLLTPALNLAFEFYTYHSHRPTERLARVSYIKSEDKSHLKKLGS